MTFSIEKLGRINAAQIEIKPLTLFIGKNDSGKTYGASAIWALVRFVKDLSYHSSLKNIPNQLNILDELIKNPSEGKFAIHLSEENINLIQKDIRQSFAKASPKLLADAIGYDGFDNSKVSFTPSTDGIKKLSINITIRKSTDFQKIVSKEEGEDYFFESINNNVAIEYQLLLDGATEREFSIELRDLTDACQILQHQFSQDIAGYAFFGKAWKNYRNTVYLPAARTGIMLAIDFFVSGTMQRNALNPQKSRDIPQSSLPAPLRAFAADLTYPAFPSRENDLLATILSGSYARTKRRGEYKYTPSGMDIPIPLASTSSLVTELAGFALMLRTVDVRNSFLIFEEPEAHLHLEAQREIAKILVKLANTGKRLLVTTHSDTFLQQINNLIALNDHPERERLLNKLGINENLTINRKNVAAYDFQCVNNVTVVKPLKCNKNGFIAPSLNEVLIKLTQETIAIQHGRHDDDEDNETH